MNCFCTLIESQDEEVSQYGECTYEEVWNFVKSLFHIYWDDLVIFVIPSIKTDVLHDWFYDVKPMLHSWDKAYLVIVSHAFYIFDSAYFHIVCWGILHLHS